MILPFHLTGHAIFKVTYLSNHDYKPLYFESDAATVNEIVLKVSFSRANTKASYTDLNCDSVSLELHFYKSSRLTEILIIFCHVQVNYILESRASTTRADYSAQKQRKLSRRTSFSFQKDKKTGQ